MRNVEMNFMRNGGLRWLLVIASLMFFDVWGARVEDIAVGSVKWDYFALDGNLQRIRETGAVDTLSNVSAQSISYTTDRYGQDGGAVLSAGGVAITFNNLTTLFTGGYILNNGLELNKSNRGQKREWSKVVEDHGTYPVRVWGYYFPYAPVSQSEVRGYTEVGGSLVPNRVIPEGDATYMLWFRLDQTPTETQALLSRTLKTYKSGYLNYTYTDYNAFTNSLLEVQILGGNTTSPRCLKVEPYVSSKAVTSNKALTMGVWHCLVLAGNYRGNGVVYLDGEKIATIPQNVQLGYWHAISDNRAYTNDYGDYKAYKIVGSVDSNPVTLTIGKIPGAIDDIVFYHSSLTATQVKNLYEVGCPRPPSVINVTATPRYPWNGKVDLEFAIDGTSGMKYNASFSAQDVAGNTNLTMKTLYKSNGTAANVAKEQLAPGTYNWVWDATADLGVGTMLDRVTIIIDVK